MRGDDTQQAAMFSYVMPEQRVPENHPLRPILAMVNQALDRIDRALEKMYAEGGRPSIAPEKLLRALLLQMLYSVRSERMLMEQMQYNLLFRWFVGLNMDDQVWDVTVFTKNRDRLLEGDIAQRFFQAVLAQANAKQLLSDEHFSVDGTLLEAWASDKSFQKKPDPPQTGTGSRGETLLNDTHASRTDPDARKYRKSRGAAFKLVHMGHVLSENRNGLAVGVRVTVANPKAERETALDLLRAVCGKRRQTVGGDKGFDERDFVTGARQMGVTPHVSPHTRRPSQVDGRTTRHGGFVVSQRKRKRIEEIFGWIKSVGLLRKVRHRGRAKVGWMFTMAAAAYNLVRMRTLRVAAA
jgi:transposase